MPTSVSSKVLILDVSAFFLSTIKHNGGIIPPFTIFYYKKPRWWNGRHVGFKIRCLRAWGFKSPPRYHALFCFPYLFAKSLKLICFGSISPERIF